MFLMVFAALLSIGVSDIDRIVASSPTRTAKFRLSGQITAAVYNRFVFSDHSGSAWIYPCDNKEWKIGDHVSMDCSADANAFGVDTVDVCAMKITVLQHGTPPPTRQYTTSDIEAGKADYKSVRVRGVISEAFRDEVNPDFFFLLLESSGVRSTVVCNDRGTNSIEKLMSAIDAGVEVTGACVPFDRGYRFYLGRKIYISSFDNDIRFLSASDAFPVGQGENVSLSGPMIADNRLFPHRRQLTGTVIANRSDGRFFLRTDKGRCVRVHLMRGTPSPVPGHHVTVAGFLRTDLFFAKLINAVVLDNGTTAQTNDAPLNISAKKILYDSSGRPKVNPTFDGRIIRLTGTVRDIIPDHLNQNAFCVESDGIAIIVEARPADHPPANSIVQITGMCLITSQDKDNSDGFTRLNGFSVITRDSSDITIMTQAPWWTAGRLVATIWILLAVILGALLWIRILRKMVERRSKALLKEEASSISAFLKTRERTSLAVELHDSFSQSLKGISLRLDAALKTAKLKPEVAERNLLTARHMLTSCHEELRDCIRDLRNNIYSDGNVTEAIQMAAARYADEAEVTVRCDIPRKRLKDSTFHAILMIIRELSSNAVRHGKARHIAIAAHLSPEGLSIDVSDDGVGFDPQNRPGVPQGHFGLQGVSERVAHLNGTLVIQSMPGHGTHITFSIPFGGSDNEAD